MKPNVLAIGREDNGILFHRIWTPLKHLERNGYIDLRMVKDWSELSDDTKRADGIVHRRIRKEEFYGVTHLIFSRQPNLLENHIEGVLATLKARGVKIIVDVDDWWYLPPTHLRAAEFMRNRMPQRIEASLKMANEVWTTHKHLAKKVKRFNKNIRIVPNAVDLEQSQWKNHEKPKRDPVIGYIGASNHEHDVAMMGLDLSGYPHLVPNDHLIPEMLRATNTWDWCKPNEYGNIYRGIDISLVPLMSSEFSKCKSNLKLIEAAFTNTAVIVSPVYPYTPHLDDGLNCLVARTPEEWRSAVDRLANDRERCAVLANELRTTMQGYTMDKINETRLKALK